MTTLTLDQIKQSPKALLHDHLDGGLRPATVVELAEQTRRDNLATFPTFGELTWKSCAISI